MIKGDKFITDIQPNSKVYCRILAILKDLTGITWGYVKNRNKVKYITSESIPVKIGINWKKKKKEIPFDITISNKFPSYFPTNDEWENAVRMELRVALIGLITDSDVLKKINQWVPTGEFAENVLAGEEQNKSYFQRYGENLSIECLNVYDPWLEICLKK